MNNLEPTNVAIALFAMVFGSALAEVVGPYAVILLGSTIGAAWSLGGRDPTAKSGAVWYFLRINGTALLVTVPLSYQVSLWLGHEDAMWLLAPTALAIGLVGDNWPQLAKFLARKALAFFERRSGGGPV